MSISGRVVRFLLLIAPTALLCGGGVARRWIGDDGFINVRVAKQLIQGNGLVFNAGERVETVTSPLWSLLLALSGCFGARLEDAAVSMGLGLSAAGMLLATIASIRIQGGPRDDALFVPFGAIIYASLPASWDYVTSALENALGLFWLGLSACCVARALDRAQVRPRVAGALAVGIAPLVRPDYVAIGLPLGLLLVCTGSGRRTRLAVLAAGLVPSLLFQLFRMGYYAALVPNTALAKEAFAAYWTQGRFYLENTLRVYRLIFPLVIVLAGVGAVVARQFSRRRGAAMLIISLFVGGVLHAAYVVRVGGDFMHARLLLPGLFSLLSAIAFVRIELGSTMQVAIPLVPCLAVWLWAAQCATKYRVPHENENGIGDERGWHARMAHVKHPTRLEHYKRFFFYAGTAPLRDEIARTCEGGAAALAPRSTARCQRQLYLHGEDGPIAGERRTLPLKAGAVPVSSIAVVSMPPLGIASNLLGTRVNVVDVFGLADPIAARMELRDRGRPGHEKAFGTAWLAAKYVAPGVAADAAVAVAAEVLECPQLRALAEATRSELTVARFLRNIVLSFSLHRLRIPADPHQAKAALCGAAKGVREGT